MNENDFDFRTGEYFSEDNNLSERTAGSTHAMGKTDHEPQGSDPDDPRQAFLRQWIAQNEPALHTALRPIGGTLAETRGVSSEEATADLLVEVTRIALAQAFIRYDMTYLSPRLWLLKIAHFVRRRWREQASNAFDRQGNQAPDREFPDDLEFKEYAAKGKDSDLNDPAHIVVNQMWLQHRLAGLSPEDKKLVQYQIVEQLSFRETARNLGISEGAARVRYWRAIKRLRLHEEEDGEFYARQSSAGQRTPTADRKYSEEDHE